MLRADDKRFKTLKKTLNKNFLLGRQEYPKDVLASNRLMTDFDPDVATWTKRTQEQVQPTDVDFVESGGGEFPICYYCGNKFNKYGWRRCPTSSQKVKDKTAKLVKAGHFSPEKKNTVKDSDDASTLTAPPKNMADKKGTTFAVVEVENKDDDLPTFEDYLRREGMIYINVQNDTLGFTGDTIAEYRVGCADIDDLSTPPPPSTIPVLEGEENPIIIELLTARRV